MLSMWFVSVLEVLLCLKDENMLVFLVIEVLVIKENSRFIWL